ncbi:hypothetical protein BZA05DRAFT_394331 [Tricharina praecox]|uniref:uncharacterized protein n=1 Tax=Tricharina praecox TaxID=43433 RepID=UPI002220F518|nr:uncharacterized protein BZA05DRAFT_394331 [Tricharina praecox]KAI5854469.1 hypothetical protein BZA05DRAFT_394331 [Tricharina praecox]
MSTSAAGTTFNLRTPAHIKSCHVTGSWDNYGKRYQMTPDPAAGAGYWTLTLKFGATMAPSRYFYYFILDGYFESHDPNMQTIVEPSRKLTLNILDYGIPSSPASTTSSRSSRRSSPSSVSSPTSSVRSSKRSGGVYDLPSPLADSSEDYYHHSNHGRTRSPHRQQSELSYLVHPQPRNPLAAHKLTLDTNYYAGRPVSVMTHAATTAGAGSPSSSRSGSSCGSLSSRGSSPLTPYDSDDEDRYVRYAPAPKGADEDLSYRLERSLRM